MRIHDCRPIGRFIRLGVNVNFIRLRRRRRIAKFLAKQEQIQKNREFAKELEAIEELPNVEVVEVEIKPKKQPKKPRKKTTKKKDK